MTEFIRYNNRTETLIRVCDTREETEFIRYNNRTPIDLFQLKNRIRKAKPILRNLRIAIESFPTNHSFLYIPKLLSYYYMHCCNIVLSYRQSRM